MQVVHLAVEHGQRGRRMFNKKPQKLFAFTQRLFGAGVCGPQAERLDTEFKVSREFRQQLYFTLGKRIRLP